MINLHMIFQNKKSTYEDENRGLLPLAIQSNKTEETKMLKQSAVQRNYRD